MDPVTHPHVNPHVVWPKKLTLFFAGIVPAGVNCWAWALMDDTDLYASDRGTVKSTTWQTPAWAATVGLGKGCRFLHDRGWRGKLTVKGHQRDCGIFGGSSDAMIDRCKELLQGIRWKAECVEWMQNDFAAMLCNQAAKE